MSLFNRISPVGGVNKPPKRGNIKHKWTYSDTFRPNCVNTLLILSTDHSFMKLQAKMVIFSKSVIK